MTGTMLNGRMNRRARIGRIGNDKRIAEAFRLELITGCYSGAWLYGWPEAPGGYERLTALGVRLDFFDGNVWRRRPYAIACANQDLPWREAGCA